MICLRYPCRLFNVSFTNVRSLEKIVRIYTSQKVLPKQHLDSADLSVNQNEFTTVHAAHVIQANDKISNPVIDLTHQNEVRKGVKGREAWKEIALDVSQLGKHCLKLSKFRLTTLVVITSAVGYALPPAPFDPSSFLYCTIGTGLVSSAANSINQFMEVPFDAQMSRTKNRVLVQGKMMPIHAIAFAMVAGSVGLSMLYYGTNALTAGLGAVNLVLYTTVYTPLKRISIVNTWVGSVVGAIPPLMGWAACEGSLSYSSLIIGGILYAWQFPHFNALSWNLRPDYSRAGYRMMSVTNPDLCRATALRYTIGIIVLSGLAPVLDLTHWSFALLSLPLNLYFTLLAFNFYKESDSKNSRKLFRYSLVHLPALLMLMLILKKQWSFNTATNESKKERSIYRISGDNFIIPTDTVSNALMA